MANPEYKIITAQYRGQCSACGERIAPGDKIKYAKGSPTLHATCETPEIPADAIHLDGGSGYGCSGWAPKTVIRNPNPRVVKSVKRVFECKACGEELSGNICLKGSLPEHRGSLKSEIEVERPGPGANQPEYLFVLTSSARYVREDGLSFGVGDESGYIYSATCRPATDEESAPLREAIAKAEARRVAAKALRDLYTDLWRSPEAECPEKVERIEGETITVRDSSQKIVISADCLWLVTYNGRDGDDWSPNNYGGHSIAKRLPRTAEVVDEARTLFIAASGAPKEGR